MAKLGKDKIALFLACASIFRGNTQAAQDVKTGQTLAAVGGAAFNTQLDTNVRVKNPVGNQNFKGFGTKEKFIAAGAILASLGIGAVGGYVASNVFSGYSQGKEYAIKYFHSCNTQFIDFNAGIFVSGAPFGTLPVTKALYPELKGEKLNKKAIEIDNVLRVFHSKYSQNLFKKYIEIASRHKFCVFGEATEGFQDIRDLIIRVVPEDKKLTVRILQLSDNGKENLNEVTESFIEVEKENGKAFIEDLVRFANSDDFMKQVLLGGKDEKAEGKNETNENE